MTDRTNLQIRVIRQTRTFVPELVGLYAALGYIHDDTFQFKRKTTTARGP